MASIELTLRIAKALTDIPSGDWDACANPDPATHDPFLSHAFLKALEDSGCVGDKRTRIGSLAHAVQPQLLQRTGYRRVTSERKRSTLEWRCVR